MRRALARSCKIESPEESSINSGAFASLPAAPVSFGKSRSARNPSRMFRKFTRDREQSMRNTSDSEVISRLNTPTGSFCSIATCSAIFMASDVLPMLGRAAITTISPPCKPLVILSRSVKPGPDARQHSLPLMKILDRVDRFIDQILDRAGTGPRRALR